jgi:acyl-CoA synthetase (AMP-forming)/AMP-acid ligase II/acyl carrier protein
MSGTIIDCIAGHARNQPDALAFRFLNDLEHAPEDLSFAQLWQEAGALAQFLSGIAEPGSRIMLFFPPGLAYIKAFYGCLMAGMVAVPLYPPRRNVKSDRIMKVAHSCQSVIALSTHAELAAVKAAWDMQNCLGLPLEFHATDRIVPGAGAPYAAAPAGPDTPAFLQYTSGSTGVPKGVIITHGNIMANVAHLSAANTGAVDGEVFVNWVPLFHDLGLVTAILWPVYLGAPSILMAPATFVRSPLVWLQAISRYRATMCGAPNFAFDLCVDKIPAAELAGLDLSSWRVAYNSAEPVKAATLERFTRHFAPCGWRAETFYPCYGMAEATVFIAGGDTSARPVVLAVDKDGLADFRLEPVAADAAGALRIVGCGSAHGPHAVRIVDPASSVELADGKVGEVWFSGPSVSPGYWQLDDITAQTFGQRIAGEDGDDGYLRTGDYGVKWQGELFITGRMKDLIIVRGRNYYPQDIEASAAAAHPAIRSGCCAAFALDQDGDERLVVVAEIEREFFRSIDGGAVASAIRQRILLDHETGVDQIVLLKPYKLPMTSSGKIQRRQTRQMLIDNELDAIGAPAAPRAAPAAAPGTDTERMLCAVWRQVLKREQLGVTDNFFDLGGDSMAALEVSAMVQRHFPDIELDVAQLFDFPTIAQLAGFLELKAAHARNKAAAASQAPRKVVRI